jgi:hypothetical protein
VVESETVEPRQLDAEHVPIEEQQRTERLVLRRGAHAPILGQVREKSSDLGGPQHRGMTFVVKQDVSLDPEDVRLLGAAAHVPRPYRRPNRSSSRGDPAPDAGGVSATTDAKSSTSR